MLVKLTYFDNSYSHVGLQILALGSTAVALCLLLLMNCLRVGQCKYGSSFILCCQLQQGTTTSIQTILIVSFHNTLNLEPFKTACQSASTLRYYSLRLENGNYNVDLQFSGKAFKNPATWKSVGCCLFYIYIQVLSTSCFLGIKEKISVLDICPFSSLSVYISGEPCLKDFDVQKEADRGASPSFPNGILGQLVSENSLKIHLSLAGKGTCFVCSGPRYLWLFCFSHQGYPR